MLSPKHGEFVAAPGFGTLALVAASIAVYILCSLKAGSSQIAAPLLQQYGALSAVVLKGQESWRLLSYGFLHATPIALGFNMLCLLAWGSILEKHISFLQYLVVYAVALIGAGLIGVHAHSPPFLIVGAQGAVGGVFGALVSLCMLGRIPLPLTFFVVAIVLNVGFAFVFPKAGWSVPAGGFAVGLLVGGLLGNLARLTDRVLRCKFPEWVKLELLLLLAFGAYAVSVAGVVKLSLTDVRGGLLMLGGALVAIKLVDLILYMKRGLAVIAVLFAIAYAVVPVVFHSALVSVVARQCLSIARPMSNAALLGQLRAGLCEHQSYAVYAVAALAFVTAILVHFAPLRRGLRDVGFVDAGFRGERKRAVA